MLDRLSNPLLTVSPLWNGYIVLLHAAMFALGAFLIWAVTGDSSARSKATRNAVILVGMTVVSVLCWIPGLWLARVLPPFASAPLFWIGASTVLAREGDESFRITLVWLFYWTWIAGSAFAVMRCLVGQLFLQSITTRASRIDDPEMLHMVSQCTGELRMKRRVHLRLSSRVLVPFTHGVFRPVIVLPSQFIEWNDERRKLILLHELAHVKRFDSFIQFVSQLCAAWYWFFPLIWAVRSSLRLSRERAADDMVVASGVSPTRYAAFLMEMSALLLPGSRRAGFAGGVGFIGHHSIKARVRSVLAQRSRSYSRARVSFTIVACAAWAAVAGLVRLSPERSHLLERLHSSAWEDRAYTARLVSRTRSPLLRRALINSALNDPHPIVRRIAGQAAKSR